jgi:voltage-gated potassium channel
MMKYPRVLRTFREGPTSARKAIRAIVAVTIVATLAGGFLVWIFDREEFPTLSTALWWSLQTVTTVGYGDVTPAKPIGRAIGAVVLLYSVAFLAILTAAITSAFVTQARRELAGAEDPEHADMIARLDTIATRLEAIEQELERQRNGSRRST